MSRLLASLPVPIVAVLLWDKNNPKSRSVNVCAHLLPLDMDRREAVIDALDSLTDAHKSIALNQYGLPMHDFLTPQGKIVSAYRSMDFLHGAVVNSYSIYHQNGRQHGLMTYNPELYGDDPTLKTFGLRKGFLRKLYEENRFRPATEEDADPFNKRKLVICDLDDRSLMVPADENGVPLEIDDPNAREQDVFELFAANKLLGYDKVPSTGGFFYAPAAYF